MILQTEVSISSEIISVFLRVYNFKKVPDLEFQETLVLAVPRSSEHRAHAPELLARLQARTVK